MNIHFEKYQGTGNDFIMIDNTNNQYDFMVVDDVKKLCKRRFGIGADGLILINSHADYDFEMRYFNADGTMSFCGNGARCAVHFAQKLKIIKDTTRFLAIDGVHEARIFSNEIALKMNDVTTWKEKISDYEINTGSPHYIIFVDNLSAFDIIEIGKNIRYSDPYKLNGINVNLAEVVDNKISMLTYERGVEGETFSCGTGATAVAIAHAIKTKVRGSFSQPIYVKGGVLTVSAEFNGEKFTNIILKGPATYIFNGTVRL